MRILITGGTGYVGSHIALHLVQQGHQVDVAARGPLRGATDAERQRAMENLGIRVFEADLSRPGDLRTRIDARPYEVIVHGVSSFLETKGPESLTLRAGEEVLAFANGSERLSQIIDLGNCLVLADAGKIAIPTEDFPCRPNTIHGRNKLMVEQRFKNSGLPWVILRIGQVYGGIGSSFDWVVLDGIRRGALPLPGNGANRVGLVHVEDVAQLVGLVIDQGLARLVLNAGSEDTQLTQGQVFDAVADAFGVAHPRRIPLPAALLYAQWVETVATLRGKTPAFVPDMIRTLAGSWLLSIEKAKQMLGYQPKYPHSLEGIRQSYADVFAGHRALFVPPARLAEVRGLKRPAG